MKGENKKRMNLLINNIEKEIKEKWNDEKWLRQKGEEYLKAAKEIREKDFRSWAGTRRERIRL